MTRFVTGLLLAGLVALAGSTAVHAQEREVRGTVTDAVSGIPLPGVNVTVLGTNFGTATGPNGQYSLQVPGPDAVLVYSFIGYLQREEEVGARTVINVTLREDVQLLDDVIVVGYGTQRRGDVTGSVGFLDADDVNIGLVTSPDRMLQGRVAGVQVIQTGGEPGAGTSVRIRGGTSIAASNEPLYVIDGVPIDNATIIPGGTGVSGAAAPPSRNPLNLINPNDIESISVLKDAAATAIYGSRGANGVVLIQTRRGREGQVSVDYEGRVSSAAAARTLDLLSGEQYRAFIQELVAQGELGQEAIDNLGPANTNFQDAILQRALSHQHNLSFAGGTAATQFRASLNYLNQEGIVISSGIERVSARLNASNQSLDGRLRIGLNLTSSLANDDFVAYENTGGFEGGLFTNVFDFNPTFPVQTDDGRFFEIAGQRSIRNPVALAEQIQDDAQTTRTLGNVSAEFDLFEGLTANLNIGGDRSVSRRSTYFPQASPVGAEFQGRALQRDLQRSSVTLQSYLSWRQRLRETHNYDVVAGYEWNEFDNQSFGVEARNFVTDATGADNIGAGASLISGGTFSNREQNRLISFFSRANYNFAERFYLSGSLRYDGSSRFGAENQWALFPAISGAWRISEEGFLRDNTTISDLRLRAGFGVVGNQAIPNYLSLPLLVADPGSRAVLGGQIVTGYRLGQLPNPNLRWEQKQEVTVGVDYGLIGGRLFGALEFYRNTTEDLLLQVALPQPAPVASRVENVGSIRNTGIDFSLDGFVIDRPETTLQLGIVFNTNRNEILDLGLRQRIFTGSVSGRGQSGQNALLLTPGQPFPVFYGFEFAGFNDAGQQLFNQYEDTTGDGFGDTLIGQTTSPTDIDRQIIGDPRPDFSYGFRSQLNWHQFGVSMFWRGEQGRELFNNTALIFQTRSAALQGRNFLADALDAPDAFREAPVFSSRWIENASFLKLDNLTFEYRVPAGMFGANVRAARAFLSVDNVFTITPYTGYDPEVNTNAQVGLIPAFGIDYTNYPMPRTITLGFNLGF